MKTLTKCSIICIFTLLASCTDEPALSQMDLQRVTALEKPALSQIELQRVMALDDIVAKLQAWAELGTYNFNDLAAYRQELATATAKTESLYNSVYLTSLNRLLNQAFLNWGEWIDVIDGSPRDVSGSIICDYWGDVLPPNVYDLCKNRMPKSNGFMAGWKYASIRILPAIPVLTNKILKEISKL